MHIHLLISLVVVYIIDLPSVTGHNRLTSMPGAGTTKDENEVVAIKGESR